MRFSTATPSPPSTRTATTTSTRPIITKLLFLIVITSPPLHPPILTNAFTSTFHSPTFPFVGRQRRWRSDNPPTIEFGHPQRLYSKYDTYFDDEDDKDQAPPPPPPPPSTPRKKKKNASQKKGRRFTQTDVNPLAALRASSSAVSQNQKRPSTTVITAQKVKKKKKGSGSNEKKDDGSSSSSTVPMKGSTSSVSSFEWVNPNQPPPRQQQQRGGGGKPKRMGGDIKSSGGGKSIEELEQSMMARFGTDDSKWTADFDEFEVSFDDNDDDSGAGGGSTRGSFSGSTTSSTPPSSSSSSSSPKNQSPYRPKPVLNPWQEKERREEYAKLRARQEAEEQRLKTNAEALSSTQKGTDEDLVLKRIRRNQDKLRENKMRNGGGGGGDEEEEEEKGDAGSGADGENSFFFMAPPPSSSESATPSSESSSMNNRGGTKNDESSILGQTTTKKKKEKAPMRPVKMDENGREMYLTLDNAQDRIRAILATNDNDEDPSLSSAEAENDEDESTVSSWEEIGITNPVLLQNLADMECQNPLFVQNQSCPPTLDRSNDVLISTHTGSGKTLAFLAPLAQRIIDEHYDGTTDDDSSSSSPPPSGVKVIILAPGRELASQIVDVTRSLLQNTPLTATLAIGGTPLGRNYERLRKNRPTFVVGTPGRIAELLVGTADSSDSGGGKKSVMGKWKIKGLESVVLDECDALLEYKAHREPTVAVMDALRRRWRDRLQVVLCSATATDLLKENEEDDDDDGDGGDDDGYGFSNDDYGGDSSGGMIERYLRPQYIHAQSDDTDKLVTSTSPDLTTRVSRTTLHGIIHIPHRRFALSTLRRILYTEPTPQQILIFVSDARRVTQMVDRLAESDIIAAPLHGGARSEKSTRSEVVRALRDGTVGIVVATEMAARGLDAPYLTHVVNLDLPTDAAHYAHRAGRVGRGGRPGVVLNVSVGERERKVPRKFGSALEIEMYDVEARGGKLVILE